MDIDRSTRDSSTQETGMPFRFMAVVTLLSPSEYRRCSDSRMEWDLEGVRRVSVAAGSSVRIRSS